MMASLLSRNKIQALLTCKSGAPFFAQNTVSSFVTNRKTLTTKLLNGELGKRP
jgi:hypothetical protein